MPVSVPYLLVCVLSQGHFWLRFCGLCSCGHVFVSGSPSNSGVELKSGSSIMSLTFCRKILLKAVPKGDLEKSNMVNFIFKSGSAVLGV